MIKYCLHPGYVISQSDGDRHFIGQARLVELYGVRPAECVVYHRILGHKGFDGECLYPSPSGAYILGPEPLPRP